MIKETEEQIKQRFWKNVLIKSKNECWEWQVSLSEGYGQLKIHYKKTFAHRYSWELYHKRKIPKGKQICHHCDNRKCVNPRHLYCGTQQQNLKDRDKRSHHLLGHPKLHEGEIWLIRKLNVLKKQSKSHHIFSLKFVGKMFNVKGSTIYKIWNQNKRLSRERTRV